MRLFGCQCARVTNSAVGRHVAVSCVGLFWRTEFQIKTWTEGERNSMRLYWQAEVQFETEWEMGERERQIKKEIENERQKREETL